MNSLHKILFITEDDSNGKVVGTTTLLVGPKFINKGMQVGYIEDVSVKKKYEGLEIISKLIPYATNMPFQEKDTEKYC
jgi:hypothetical protein